MHHACNSSSPSCTSSLMSPLSSSTLLDEICRNVSSFHTDAANCGVTFANFSCPLPPFLPPVLDHCLFPARFAPSSSPLPLLKYFCTRQLGPFPPFRPPLPPVPLYTALHCKFRYFSVPFFKTLPRHRFLLPCRSPLVRSCQCSLPWMPNVSSGDDVADQRRIRRASV